MCFTSQNGYFDLLYPNTKMHSGITYFTPSNQIKRSDHITPVLRAPHWLPVHQRIMFKAMALVYTALHDPKAPKYIRDTIKEYTPPGH